MTEQNKVASFDRSNEDIFIGLLAPIGTNKDSVVNQLSKQLQESFDYDIEVIKLSDFIKQHYKNIFDDPSIINCKFCERRSKIIYGTQLRKSTNDPAILAKMSIAKIRSLPSTKEDFGSRDDGRRRAFIFDQIKRREEIEYLSGLYGKAFFLLGIHAPTDQRLKRTAQEIGKPESYAQELLELDLSESDHFNHLSTCKNCNRNSGPLSPHSEDKAIDYGQQLRDIFAESDIFVADHNCSKDITKFLDLIFGSPLEFPSSSEHAMFLAFAASTRSADLSRQVGAAITSSNGDIISVGSNDVPKAGGGIYDLGNHKNDAAFGYEANSKRISEIADNIANSLVQSELITSDKKTAILATLLKKSDLPSLTEFHRTVHAEMQAIMSATRSGVSTKDGSIYVTTFPCHNCAKHIVSSGIKEVVFVEPYPKSLANRLHQDSISVVEDGTKIPDKVIVRPFLGVGPRRFIDLYSLKLSAGSSVKRKVGFSASEFIRSSSPMRFALAISAKDLEPLAEKKYLNEIRNNLIRLQKLIKDGEKSEANLESERVLKSITA